MLASRETKLQYLIMIDTSDLLTLMECQVSTTVLRSLHGTVQYRGAMRGYVALPYLRH